MNNPGLNAFSYIRSPNHPLNIDPMEDDPELGENDDNASDYVPPVNFGRWRNPGQSLRVPVHQGPPFTLGETPEDVIHGEVISPAEQDGADKILNGDHESDAPSENPFVEHARQDLHTPESTVAVHALSGLLSGVHPGSVPREAMDAAHWYLSKHFTGLRVNPHHGTLVAASPVGIQMVKRHAKPQLAISDRPAEVAPTYSLINKHGTFESKDPKKLVRAMLAFQIVHNEIAQQEQQSKKDDQDDDGLTATSGVRDWMRVDSPSASGPISWKDALLRRTRPAVSPARAPDLPAPGAVFEPGYGTDKNANGVRGGYVAHSSDAPLHWRRDSSGVAYSPGHSMNELLDPKKAASPRSDPYFPGHTYTYIPNFTTGHTIERRGGGVKYFVNRLHPAARGAGFDLPSAPPKPKPAKAIKPPKKTTKPKKTTTPAPVPAATPASPVVIGRPPISRPPVTSAVQNNDLCPVCVSGYLEPYDSDTHECLNCGSLVKHVGFEKESARQPRGLGRGLSQIPEPEGDPLNLASGGSEDPEDEIPESGYVHPLADEELDSDYIGYEAPRNILDRTSALVDTDVNDEDNLRYFKDTDFKPDDHTATDQPMISLKHIYDNGENDWDSPSLYEPGDMCETCWVKDHHIATPEDHKSSWLSHEYKPISQNQRFSSTHIAGEADPLDEQLGKQGFFPIHKPGEERAYLHPMQGLEGSYWRLTEGAPHPKTGERGWALTADHIPTRDQWTHEDVPVRGRGVNLPVDSTDPESRYRRHMLPDLGERPMSQQNVLAAGTHPIDDDHLNRAIRDVSENGRNSATYQDKFALAYEPPSPYPSGTTQRELRGLSSVNPGLSRW